MSFEPADAAPGDTITVYTYYAGKVFDSQTWRVSFEYHSNAFGFGSAVDTVELTASDYYIPGSESLSFDSITGTTTASVRFIIPPDVIRVNAPYILASFKTLRPEVLESLPPGFSADDPDGIIDNMEVFADLFSVAPSVYAACADDSTTTYSDLPIDSARLAAFVGVMGLTELPNAQVMAGILEVMVLDVSIQQQVSAFSRMFTAVIRLYQETDNGVKGSGSLITRYTGRMKYNPHARINRNPELLSLGVYREASGKVFDISDQSTWDALYRLYSSTGQPLDTVEIDDARKYFVGAVTDPAIRDLGLSMTPDSLQGSSASDSADLPIEEYYYSWRYQNNVAIDGVPADSLVMILGGADSIVEFLPPRDTRMNDFTIWCTVYDDYWVEGSRPRGLSMRAARGYIKFVE